MDNGRKHIKWLRVGRYRIPVTWWIYRGPFMDGKLWPFSIWFYRWGIGFHWRSIADAHIRLGL